MFLHSQKLVPLQVSTIPVIVTVAINNAHPNHERPQWRFSLV